MGNFTTARGHALYRNHATGKLPPATVRLLVCVNFLIDSKHRALKNILAHAADYVGPDAILSLSQESLAHFSGYTPRWISAALGTAERLGYLERLTAGRGRSKTPRYRVLLLARYPEAAALKQAWHARLKPEVSSTFTSKKAELSSGFYPQNRKWAIGKPELSSADPDKETERPLTDRNNYPYPSYEETLKNRREVLGPKIIAGK
jgi:hypothetical protein